MIYLWGDVSEIRRKECRQSGSLTTEIPHNTAMTLVMLASKLAGQRCRIYTSRWRITHDLITCSPYYGLLLVFLEPRPRMTRSSTRSSTELPLWGSFGQCATPRSPLLHKINQMLACEDPGVSALEQRLNPWEEDHANPILPPAYRQILQPKKQSGISRFSFCSDQGRAVFGSSDIHVSNCLETRSLAAYIYSNSPKIKAILLCYPRSTSIAASHALQQRMCLENLILK